MKLATMLAGKKTFLLSAVTVAATVAAVALKQMTIVEGVAMIASATGLSTVRAGSKADAAAVVTTLAPVIAATVPGKAGTIASEVAQGLKQVLDAPAPASA